MQARPCMFAHGDGRNYCCPAIIVVISLRSVNKHVPAAQTVFTVRVRPCPPPTVRPSHRFVRKTYARASDTEIGRARLIRDGSARESVTPSRCARVYFHTRFKAFKRHYWSCRPRDPGTGRRERRYCVTRQRNEIGCARLGRVGSEYFINFIRPIQFVS